MGTSLTETKNYLGKNNVEHVYQQCLLIVILQNYQWLTKIETLLPVEFMMLCFKI